MDKASLAIADQADLKEGREIWWAHLGETQARKLAVAEIILRSAAPQEEVYNGITKAISPAQSPKGIKETPKDLSHEEGVTEQNTQKLMRKFLIK